VPQSIRVAVMVGVGVEARIKVCLGFAANRPKVSILGHDRQLATDNQ